MSRNFTYTIFALLCIHGLTAQSITGQVTDAKTGESIPYANIVVNNSEVLISNADGYFSLSDNNNAGSSQLTVSFMGYSSKQITVDQLKKTNTVALAPGFIDLDIVDVSNVRPDAYQIMQEVKKNLARHYKITPESMQDKLFYRKSTVFKPEKFELEIDKSTGYSKQALKSTNATFDAFTASLIAHPTKDYTDMLCNMYTSPNQKTDAYKVDVVKATKLRNEGRSVSIDELEKAFTNIFLKHLDTMKYYRIKSGLIGSRDTLSLRKDFKNKKQKAAKKTNQVLAKSDVTSFMLKTNFLNSEEMDFVNHPEYYEYAYEGATMSPENDLVYVLNFKPKKSRANYTGKLYVSESDYAVVRTDYKFAKGKTGGGVNAKWLLGIKYSDNLSNGTLIYKQNKSGDGYYLQYGAVESGQYFYVHRPLKFIELTDEERDVVAFDFKVEGDNRNKVEVLNISRSEISDATFNKVDEKDFNYISLKRYDPNVWKDYTSIEPLEEMKQFKAVD